MADCTVLKRGMLGTVLHFRGGGGERIVRDTTNARRGLAWLARYLARHEREVLQRAAGITGVPAVLGSDTEPSRQHLHGVPMHLAEFEAAAYFKSALRVVRRLHRRGIVHNDLAKEANWICSPDGQAGLVDFQLALVSRQRRKLFRLLAREDLRHLLKHKRRYASERMTARQRRIVETPGWLTRVWRVGFKPVYWVVTRKVLGWPERTDACERQWSDGK